MKPAITAPSFIDCACFTSTPDSGMSNTGTSTSAPPLFALVMVDEKSREPVGYASLPTTVQPPAWASLVRPATVPFAHATSWCAK